MPHDNILDVGCGNGFSTIKIATTYPETYITGVDFSPEMIAAAKKADNYGQVDFCEGDVLALSRNIDLQAGSYDVVISTRCLINLANWAEQKLAILEMRKMLKPGGRLILVENFQEGLDNLNAIRAGVGLPPIKTRWHNKYLPMAEFKKFLGTGLFSLEYTENIGNFYYMASRVLYAKMAADKGEEPDYNHPINAIASQMPTFGEYYAVSPNYMIILKKEDDGQAKQGLPQ